MVSNKSRLMENFCTVEVGGGCIFCVLGHSAQFGDWGRHTRSASVALDFILVVRQLHSQAKVGDTDVACESKQEPEVRDTNVCPSVCVFDKLAWSRAIAA